MVVIRTATEMGFHVPRDLSVAGFDDLSGAALYNPPITTVAQDFDDMGRRAVRRLLLSETESAAAFPLEETLDTKLIVRKSTGPVP
jgi:DNA-binding LacI/PurR family transcriptional regulator